MSPWPPCPIQQLLLLRLQLYCCIVTGMFNQQPQAIEMTTIYSDRPNQQTLFVKDPTPYPLYPQVVEEETVARINRVTGNICIYWLLVLCTAGLPFINLLLFWFQPFELARGIDKENYQISNLGRMDDFLYFYIVMGLYGGVSLLFIGYSCFFTSWWERLKLYLLVDNILICMLAADVAYAALHIVSFTAVYSTDGEYNLQSQFVIYWQDYLVIYLYCMTNWAFIGIFRVLMVNIYWQPWQTIVYKMAIVLSSLIYIGIGLVYIFGDDALSKQVDDFNYELGQIIDFCYNTTEFFSDIPFLQREVSSLGDAKDRVNAFIIFYVFTNFAFSFQIIAKLTDFDGTADLKTQYKLEEEDENE